MATQAPTKGLYYTSTPLGCAPAQASSETVSLSTELAIAAVAPKVERDILWFSAY